MLNSSCSSIKDLLHPNSFAPVVIQGKGKPFLPICTRNPSGCFELVHNDFLMFPTLSMIGYKHSIILVDDYGCNIWVYFSHPKSQCISYNSTICKHD